MNYRQMQQTLLRSPDDLSPGGEAAPSEAPAAPEAAPESDSSFGDTNLDDIFRFDAFEGGLDQPDPVVAPTPTAEPEAPVASAPEPEAPAPDPMAAVVSELTKLTERLAPPPATEAPTESAEPDNFFADIQVPVELLNAIRSDDPAQASMAFTAFAQGTMNTVYKRVRNELAEFVSQALPELIDSRTASVAETKRVEQDFYGTYPQFNKPELKPLIAKIGAQIAAELGPNFQGWNEHFRDLVGSRALGLLAGIVPPAAATPAPVASGFTAPRTTRPTVTRDLADEILDLF